MNCLIQAIKPNITQSNGSFGVVAGNDDTLAGLFPKEGAYSDGASIAWLDNQGPFNPNGGFGHQENMGIAA